MQVQHEASLVEPSAPKIPSGSNKSLDSYCLHVQVSNSMGPIEHMTSSPSNSGSSLLACHTSNSNHVLLFDMKTPKKRDKFPLKACDKKYSRQSFQVSGIDFSPDGQRLAIGQTDCIIYIYKLSTLQVSSSSSSMTNSLNSSKIDDQSALGMKPTITGKFAASSPITCMRWSEHGIIFGSQDGRVRLILSFNKPPTSALSTQITPPSDASGQMPASLLPNQQQNTNTQSPKIINIFNTSKKGAMPISLAYNNSLLVVGQSDCSVAILLLTSGGLLSNDSSSQAGMSTSATSELVSHTAATNLGDNLGGLNLNRRSSSLSGQSLSVQSSLLVSHSCPPVTVLIIQSSLATTICCSGSDGKISLQSINIQQALPTKSITSQASQAIELNEDILSMDYSSVNELLAVATRNRLVFVRHDQEANTWRLQSSAIELRNVFTLSATKWLRDGSQLAIGCSSGSLELFRCVWSKQSINDKLDICHIARNRIRITDRERNLLATYKTQADIKRVNLLDQGQSVLIHTTTSLLLARLSNPRLQSEVKWQQLGADSRTSLKFLFSQANSFVIIYNQSSNELSLLKLGQEFTSYSVKFSAGQTVKRDWLSLCQFPAASLQLSPPSLSPSRLKASSRNSSASVQRFPQQQRQSSLSSIHDNGPANNQLDDPPFLDHQLLPSVPFESTTQQERFAYVTGGEVLTVVDLMNANQVVYCERFTPLVEWIKFSGTGRYLVFKCNDGRLRLLIFRTTREGDQSRVSVEEATLLEKCEGRAFWLLGSDSLVAQSGPIIHLWYDPDQRERRDTHESYDSRAFNLLNKRPLIDLSLVKREKQLGLAYPTLLKVASIGQNLQLVLSNDQVIPLNRLKTNFYALLASNSLNAAYDLLDSQQTLPNKANQTANLGPLLGKLGWLALEGEGKCELALRAFTRLGHRSLVKYLEKCLEADKTECELMLAKLRGDWTKFEALARDQEEILSTYRRLSKWSQLIDYLTRSQQFRQRDLAQRDHLQWLIKAGRRRDAAELKVRDSGDLAGALELLLDSDDLDAATDLLLKEQRLPLIDGSNELGHLILAPNERTLRNLIEFRMCDKLVSGGRDRQKNRAARIYDRILGNPSKALDLYLSARDFESAVELVTVKKDLFVNSTIQAREIHLKYANHLRDEFMKDPTKVSKKQAVKSIDHYCRANLPLEALKMANILRIPERGYEVMIEAETELLPMNGDLETDKEELLDECRKLGWLILSSNPADEATPLGGRPQFDDVPYAKKAIRAFQIGQHFEQVAELLIELRDFKGAFEVCLEHVAQDRRQVEAQFLELAKVFGEKLDLAWQAEQIYVLLNKTELAIDMYERLGEHDKMLELVERHHPDQLEGKLLLLAKWLESNGRLEEAEKYLLRASPNEWTNVVRMYRLAERWPDAFRVARTNCISEKDPLLVQLAYWWAKSIQNADEEASQHASRKARCMLLRELNLFKQVVEFCCETKNFPFALDLLDGSSHDESSSDGDQIRREVVVRYATFLEQQHKFVQAEQILVQNDLIELAVKMYTDNEDYSAAIKLIENQMNSKGDAGSAANDETPEDQKRLAQLLNATLIESARRLVEGLTPASNRGSQLMSRSQAGTVGSSQDVNNTKLQAAQQMFLRAQRPELAIEMYQSLGMWREAILVAQRFAPRLLEDVERALDEQVTDDIEPILRQTPSQHIEQTKVEQRFLEDEQAQSSNGNTSQNQQGSSMSEEARYWRQFESCVAQADQKAARASLDAYLGLLLRMNARKCISARQMRPLEKFLLEMCHRRSALASAIISQGGLPERMLSLADTIFSQETGWSGWEDRPASEVHSTWSSLRNILSCSAKLATGSTIPEEEPPMERRVLVAHFVTLHCSLVECLTAKQNQSFSSLLTIKQVSAMNHLNSNKIAQKSQVDTVDLLAKLSFSLIRYADLVDIAQLLWIAGLWQLGQKRHQMARLIWTTLVELSDQQEDLAKSTTVVREREQLASELLRAKLGVYVDLPERIHSLGSEQRVRPQLVQRLNQVRQWLLENLIEGGPSNQTPMLPRHWANLIHSHQDKSGLARACRVCGLPVGAPLMSGLRNGATPLMKRTTNAVRHEELFKLIGLCEIKSDKTVAASVDEAAPSNIELKLERLIGEIGARRSRNGGQRPRPRQLTPRDHLNEIVEFILDSL